MTKKEKYSIKKCYDKLDEEIVALKKLLKKLQVKLEEKIETDPKSYNYLFRLINSYIKLYSVSANLFKKSNQEESVKEQDEVKEKEILEEFIKRVKNEEL